MWEILLDINNEISYTYFIINSFPCKKKLTIKASVKSDEMFKNS